MLRTVKGCNLCILCCTHELIEVCGPVPSPPLRAMLVADDIGIRQHLRRVVKVTLIRSHKLCRYADRITYSGTIYQTFKINVFPINVTYLV